MKTTKLLISIAFATFILVTSAVAQTQIKANIPFKFSVADQTMPAGEYKLTMLGTVVQVVRLDGPGSAFVQSYVAAYKSDVTPKLIFNRYGQHHFLSQAWIADTHRELFASGTELEYARTNMQEQTTVLATAIPAK